MAHVGKFYKLWFRRDLAVSTNDYKFAYPEAFVLTLSGLSSTFFNLNGLADSLMYNTLNDGSTLRKWVGPSTPLPGFVVHPEFEVTDNNWGSELEFHFRLYTQTFFRVLDFRCVTEVPTSRYGRWQTRGVQETIVLDSRITFTPGNWFMGAVAATWSRYNP